VLLLAFFALCLWQASFWQARSELEPRYHVGASLGLCDDLKEFFYFHYHFNEFPVAVADGFQDPDQDPDPYSKKAARKLVENRGHALVMDLGKPCNTRFGDPGKLFLFWPSALIRQSPAAPSVRLSNVILFTGALTAVLIAFWRNGYPFLGMLLVIFLGSDPFQVLQVYGVYGGENIFSLPISVTLVVLAMHVRFLTPTPPLGRSAYMTAVATGILIASFREVRAEAAIVGVAVPFVYVTMAGRWRDRVTLLALLILSYAATAGAWRLYFDRSFASAADFVRRAGGQPYTGVRNQHHPFWHAIFVGLGDWDDHVHGYEYDDRVAYAYATPILRERYGLDLTYDVSMISPGIPSSPSRFSDYYFAETYDDAGSYHISPLDLPEYSRVVRDKVISDILHDPRWYLGILRRRLSTVMTDTTPLRLAIGRWRIGIPITGWFVFPTLLIFVAMREWFLAKLILFTLPLSLTALLVFSFGGTTYYSVFHIVAVCTWLQFILQRVGRWRGGRNFRTVVAIRGQAPKPSKPTAAGTATWLNGEDMC
jgi:hypothetical protein